VKAGEDAGLLRARLEEREAALQARAVELDGRAQELATERRLLEASRGSHQEAMAALTQEIEEARSSGEQARQGLA